MLKTILPGWLDGSNKYLKAQIEILLSQLMSSSSCHQLVNVVTLANKIQNMPSNSMVLSFLVDRIMAEAKRRKRLATVCLYSFPLPHYYRTHTCRKQFRCDHFGI